MQQESRQFGFYYLFKYEQEAIEFRDYQSNIIKYNHFDEHTYFYFLQREQFVRLDYLMDQDLRERLNVNKENFQKIISQVLTQAFDIRLKTNIQVNLDLTLIYIKIENNYKRLQLQTNQRFEQKYGVLFLEYDQFQQDFKINKERYTQSIQARQNFYQSRQQEFGQSGWLSCISKRKKKSSLFDQKLVAGFFLLNNFEDYYNYNSKYLPEQCKKIIKILQSNKNVIKSDQVDIQILNDVNKILIIPNNEAQLLISNIKAKSELQNQINSYPILKSQIYDYLEKVIQTLQINNQFVNKDFMYSKIMKNFIMKTLNSDIQNKKQAVNFLREHQQQINDQIFMILKDLVMSL